MGFFDMLFGKKKDFKVQSASIEPAGESQQAQVQQSSSVAPIIATFRNAGTPANQLCSLADELFSISVKASTEDLKAITAWCVEILKGNDSTRFSSICTRERYVSSLLTHPMTDSSEKTLLLDLILKALQNKDWKIRGAATEALGYVINMNKDIANRDNLTDSLISMLDDSIFDVRRKTVIALCRDVKEPRAIAKLKQVAEAAGDSRDWILSRIKEIP